VSKEKATTQQTTELAKLSIYPNPVQEQHTNIVFENCAFGSYLIKIYTIAGELIQSNRCKINASFQQVRLDLKKQIKAGAYKVKVISEKGIAFQETMIVE
jgi:hypothetical protein